MKEDRAPERAHRQSRPRTAAFTPLPAKPSQSSRHFQATLAHRKQSQALINARLSFRYHLVFELEAV